MSFVGCQGALGLAIGMLSVFAKTCQDEELSAARRDRAAIWIMVG
jgi:hypothetical protein